MEEPNGEERKVEREGASGPDMLVAGDRLGPYRIVRSLSHDLLSEFHLMERERSDGDPQEELVLILSKSVAADPEFESRIEAYTKRLMSLKCPSLLAVTGWEKIEGRFCIRHTPFSGQTLDSLYTVHDASASDGAGSESTVMDPDQVEALLRAVAGAFHTAHMAGIHHYSFHAASVLMGETEPVEYKVWGFGLLEMIGQPLFEKLVSAGVSPIQSSSRQVTVTPVDSLSPEMRRGAKLDSRADVYSLGNVAYRVLTAASADGDFTPPTEARPELPAFWDVLLERCLDTDPAKRPQSAAALLSELEAGATTSREEPDQATRVEHALSRIPIPSKLKQRISTRSLALVRLAVLGAFGVVVIGIGSFSFRVIMGVHGADGAEMLRQVSDPADANVVLRTAPPGAEVVIGGPVLEQFQLRAGHLLLALQPGDYRVTVRAPAHRTRTVPISATRDPQELLVRLQPDWGTVELHAPQGSRLYSGHGEDALFVAEVPEGDVLLLEDRLFTGEYAFTVARTGYVSAELEPVTLEANKPAQLSVELDPMPGVVAVRTDPEGATVLLGGVEMGESPILLEELPVEEELAVTVRLSGYREQTRTLTLTPGVPPRPLTFSLVPQTGEIALDFTTERGPFPDGERRRLSISVDGLAVSNPGSGWLELPAGGRNIRVEHPDYQVFEETVVIGDGAAERVPVNLAPRPGRLTLQFPPGFNSPYELTVDGRAVGRRDGSYPLPVWRNASVVLHARDHAPLGTSITSAPNQQHTWSVAPVRIQAPEEGRDWTPPRLDYTLKWIPPGSFRMGSPREEIARAPNEGDRRGRPIEVTLTRGFWMGSVPVTQRLYREMMGTNPSQFTGSDHPVERVSWYDAQDFLRRFNVREGEADRIPEGYAYRLPTEAEWEYAARAGSDTPFTWGASASPEQGNFRGSYPRDVRGGEISTIEQYGTTPVRSYRPSAWGLYDMHGNVWEWCVDPFHERYPSGEHIDGLDLADSGFRAVRGGSWEDFAGRCRSASRDRKQPSFAGRSVGFRIVLAPIYTGH